MVETVQITRFLAIKSEFIPETVLNLAKYVRFKELDIQNPCNECGMRALSKSKYEEWFRLAEWWYKLSPNKKANILALVDMCCREE